MSRAQQAYMFINIYLLRAGISGFFEYGGRWTGQMNTRVKVRWFRASYSGQKVGCEMNQQQNF